MCAETPNTPSPQQAARRPIKTLPRANAGELEHEGKSGGARRHVVKHGRAGRTGDSATPVTGAGTV